MKPNDTAESDIKVLTFWTSDGQSIMFMWSQILKIKIFVPI
jgi:hypothetical protein